MNEIRPQIGITPKFAGGEQTTQWHNLEDLSKYSVAQLDIDNYTFQGAFRPVIEQIALEPEFRRHSNVVPEFQAYAGSFDFPNRPDGRGVKPVAEHTKEPLTWRQRLSMAANFLFTPQFLVIK